MKYMCVYNIIAVWCVDNVTTLVMVIECTSPTYMGSSRKVEAICQARQMRNWKCWQPVIQRRHAVARAWQLSGCLSIPDAENHFAGAEFSNF